MSLDFPRAWQIARAADRDAHDPECSYVQTDGALLCDISCPVISSTAEFNCMAMHTADGVALGECPGHDPAAVA